MATARGNQLTKQTGEYLVAAELCRRGLIAATFSGNVPVYDILAADPEGRHFAIQVKAIRSSSWQLEVADFVEVRFEGQRQIIGEELAEPHPGLVCVFVALSKYGSDRFFVLEWRNLQEIVITQHREWLESHGGVRPKNPRSTHCAIKPDQLARYENAWHVVEEPA